MTSNPPPTRNFKSCFRSGQNYLRAIPYLKPRYILQDSGSQRRWIANSRLQKRLNEKLVHYLWAEQYFGHIAYQSLDGRALKMIFPGFWNLGKGPDFKQARIELGGLIRQGDIEMHLYSSDWYRHQHHRAKDYNRVMLHIALWNDARVDFVETMDHRRIPQLILAPYWKPYLEELDWLLDLPPAWGGSVGKHQGRLRRQFYQGTVRVGGTGPCYSYAHSSKHQAKLTNFILMAGEARLLTKLTRFKEQLIRLKRNYPNQDITSSYDEIIYQGIMEALGYKNNRRAFIALANEIPYRKLKEMIKDLVNLQDPIDVIPQSKSNSPDREAGYIIVIQAILFWYSGLIPHVINYHSFDPETQAYLKALQRTWLYLTNRGCLTKPSRVIDWDFYGTRPTNYPQRRIAGISYLLARAILNNGLFNNFLCVFENTISKPIKQTERPDVFIGALNPLTDNDYWSKRSKLGAKPFRRAYALIGSERISALVVNILLPILILYTEEKSVCQIGRLTAPRLRGRLLTFYKNLPPLADNYVTSFMKHRLLGNERKRINRLIKNALLQQGLFQVFYDFCAHGYEGCQNCGLIHYLKTGVLRS